MRISISYFVFCFIVCHYARKTTALVDPDTYRNVSELITSKGYPLEEHTVVTKDGYILSMQRIPHGKDNNTNTGDKKVVLLIHGELGDGKTWFLNPPGQGLGYILPEADFDVWIINCRGSTYSKKHVKYPVRSHKFWDWSFDEIAKYDIPATIDYILKETGKEDLAIIGYSRGNTVAFCMLSELPEYNKKVSMLVAFAPIAYIGNFKTAARVFIPFAEKIAAGINLVSQGEFLPTNKITRVITAKVCKLNPIELCENIMFAIAGQDKEQLNMTRVPIYSAQYPSSTSTRCLVHFAQEHESKKFRKYDFKPLRNLKEYRQLTPPDYQVSRITSPVVLFSSDKDAIADPKDVDILRKQLKFVVGDFQFTDYNHFDFIWAKDSQDRIYKPLVEILSQY